MLVPKSTKSIHRAFALEFRRMKKKSKLGVAARRGESSGQSVQVIARAASVLRTLESEPSGLSLAQIAQRVGLARSTVQRIVDALRAEHFLIAATPTSGVRLGPALIRLAASASADFDQITRPIMAKMSKKLGETVDLSVLKGFSAVFTDQVPGAHRLRAVSAVGDAFPLHCTANGKALLSVMPKQTLDRFLRSPLPRMTAATIVKAGDFSWPLKRARNRVLRSISRSIPRASVPSVPPFSIRCAAVSRLSIPVPTTRFNAMKTELVKELLKARAAIIQALGSDPRD